MLTTWDGHLRLDRLENPDRLQLTLLTVEPTTYRKLHDGLACAFVVDDPDGPPAFVELSLPNGLSADVRSLLGGRLTELTSAMSAGLRSSSEQLDLVELEELADAWAPYRSQVLSAEPAQQGAVLGTWARGLWTSIAEPALARAVAGLGTAVEQFRDGQCDPGQVVSWQVLPLPEELADAAGVSPSLEWALYDVPGEETIVLRVQAIGTVRLLAGLDDGRSAWRPFEPDDGFHRVELPIDDLSRGPVLRFRSDTEDR